MLHIFVPEVIEQQQHNNDDEVGEEDTELGESSTKGNIYALCTGLGLAAYITTVRHGSKCSKKPINLIGAASLSATITAIIALIVRKGDVLPTSFWIEKLWQL